MQRSFMALFLSGWILLVWASPGNAQNQSNGSTETVHNVILVSIDGLRREEVFAGVDPALFANDLSNREDLEQRFWDDDPLVARQKLMPFFWNKIVAEGQVFGDPTADSEATCSNGLYFSYPGYSELLCGFADPAIDSNAKKNNVNVTVLEWISRQPGFEDKIAAYTSWDVFPYIINQQRSGIPVNSGWAPFSNRLGSHAGPLNELQSQWPRFFEGVRWDELTLRGALAEMETNTPRVLYVSLGETDDWAHQGRYDLYLDAAWRNDRALRQLWEKAQVLDAYAGKTSLVVVTDHGRGSGREGWKSHGKDLPGSQFIWMAALGPNIKSLGLRSKARVVQAQTAATVAGLLGLNYPTSDARIQPPLPLKPDDE